MTEDPRIRVLDRMVRHLEGLVGSLESEHADQVGLAAASVLVEDLDRHLTALADTRYAADDDEHVREIEDALSAVRDRLGRITPED